MVQRLGRTMSPRLNEFLVTLRDLPGFAAIDSSNLGVVNSDGANALHIAIHRGDTEAARLLIEAGIDIHQPGDLGRTPLHEACAFGNIEIVRLLIEKGAD